MSRMEAGALQIVWSPGEKLSHGVGRSLHSSAAPLSASKLLGHDLAAFQVPGKTLRRGQSYGRLERR